MTIDEIIAKVDELAPNQYTTEQKIGWLSTLDGKIWHDVIMQHACPDVFYPLDGYETDDCELLVRPPYAEDLYSYYLLARIAQANSEAGKYNQYAALYDRAFNDWAAWYNRTHMPLQRGKWVL